MKTVVPWSKAVIETLHCVMLQTHTVFTLLVDYIKRTIYAVLTAGCDPHTHISEWDL